MLEAGWAGDRPLIGSKQLPKSERMEMLLHDGREVFVRQIRRLTRSRNSFQSKGI